MTACQHILPRHIMRPSLKLVLIPVGFVMGFLIVFLAEQDKFGMRIGLARTWNTESYFWGNDFGNLKINARNFTTPANVDISESTTEKIETPIKVILLTYMRSGSSFTGDLLQQPPSVFYVYEPLWAMNKFDSGVFPRSALRLLDKNVTLTVPRSEEERDAVYRHILDSYLNCRFQDIDVVTLTQYHNARSLSTQGFQACTINNRNLTRMAECLVPFTDECQRSEVRVAKVIRLDMKSANILMDADPSFKVIHLIRDPRGTLRSQGLVSNFKIGEEEKAAKDLCQKIQSDIEVSKLISSQYPGRVLTVRYEDIVSSPVEATREMYAFLKLKMRPEIENYIWNITYGGHPDNCVICTTRTNATQTAYKWRHKLQFKKVDVIQRQCMQLFSTMGYKIFNNEKDMRNDDISPLYDSYSSDLLKVKVSERTSRLRQT